MRGPLRRRRTDLPVEAGERLLAWADVADGRVVGGTRRALYLWSPSVEPLETTRVPWERVEAADWDADSSLLRVSEVGSWGSARPEHALTIEEPGRLLELVRERVSASVVLQRHVLVEGRRGLRVIARRSPGSHDPLTWLFEYDEGIDPADPLVATSAEDALAAARIDVGDA